MPTYSTTRVDMRLLAWLVLCACAVAAATQSHNVTRRGSGSGPQKRVVCYYTNWSVYRPGTAKFSPQNINPYLCTHLIYAFGGLTRENSLRPYDKYQDIEQGGYAKFTGLKTYNKQLKTILAIGGWNEGSTRFSPLVADDERRSELVHNVVRFLRQNHFDGLDLDWEYPAFRDGGKPRDRENYALLVQELRAEFDRESAKTGRPRLLLTMAVPAGIEYIDKGYDIPKLNRYLDFMNILSYDYHSAFEPAVNHHSPLYPLEEDSEYNFDAQLSIDYTINHYLKLGADRDKLVLGIPTYGRSYTLYNPLATEIGSPADGPGEQGDATREKGYLAYYEICENLQSDGWKVEHPNRNAMGPYAYKGNQWVGYDDIDIVKLKSQYVSESGLGGIMFWSIDNDDFRGKCHGRPYPLIEAGKDALLASSGTSNDVASVAPTRGHSKTRPKHPSSNSSNSSGNSGGRQGPQGGPHTHKKRPSARRQHDKQTRSTTSRASTTTSTPAYSYPQTTPEPPTTPDPGSDFKCKDEGFFPHPRDCKKYFWCLDSGPSNLGIVAHQFTCPSGLFFNKAADSCDYARNVVCKKKSGETGSSTTKAPPITAATSRTTRIGSSTASTTTSTTTSTVAPQPAAEEEEYDEDEYDEEGEEEVDAEEDPQAIKELINLIKKLGGVEQLEKQLHLQDSDQDNKSGQVTSGLSRSLYDRVLSRSNARGNSAFSGGSSTTPRYTSLYRNRPVKPQNEGLEGLEEVKAVRREKPQYVTINRNRPATPEPEDLEDEEEEDEEEDVLLPEDETQGGEDAKSHSNPVEYVTIRRARPLSSADVDTTTPRYITIQRSRKPVSEPEADDSARDADVQDITTEIRPVYTTTTERQPETRVQIVTPIKTHATEKPTGYRKVSRNGGHESTTAEPDQKVSARGFRNKPSESVIGIYPQYVDVTSIGRRRHSTTPQTELDTAPVSPLQEPLPHIQVNSITRRRNINHNNDLKVSQQLTEPSVARPEHGTAIPEDSMFITTITPDRYHSKYTDIPLRSGSTVSDYSDIPTTEKLETDNQKHEDSDTFYRKRDGTLRSTDIQSNGNQSPEINIDSNVQTTPPTTTPVTLREATPQVASIPDTIPPPTTTRLTPTITRIVTSVTESGTTERQIIAVNRVPYIALAALRGQTVYPGPLVYNRHPTVPTDETILHRTTSVAIPIQPESTTKSSAEESTISLMIQGEPKLEKVMEVNRITLVTLKEEMRLGSTRAVSGNETTERIFPQGKSDKATDNLSQVTQMKNVTVVGGSLTVTPAASYTTDMSREIFANFSTPPISLEETTHLENAIDVQDEILSAKSHNPPTTSSSSLDSFSTDTPPVTEQILSHVTSKQTDSVDESSSVGPLSNRRRQNSGRKPGIDDFRRRRLRPTFSTKSPESVASNTPSTISQKRRGQRKRPRPYRPTSTTVADEEARVLPDPDESSAKHGAVSTDQNNGHRRTFIPKRGQRRRPRPDFPTSTSTNPDELINPLESTGGENIVLITENIANKTVGFIPKRGNRRRGTTQKPTTETTNLTISATTQRDENETLSTDAKKLKDADPNLPDSDSIKSSTQGVDTFSSEPKSVFDPEENHGYTGNSTESNLKSELSDHIEVSTIRHSHSTGSFPLRNTSPHSELLLHLTSTENATDERDPQAKEMTSRPSSTLAYTESVTPSSTKSSSSASDKSGAEGSDRVRIKKRRRRPQPAQNGNTLEESARERKVLSGNKVHNDIKVSDLTAGRNFSSSTPEENAVTPFATAALLGRENYEIRTPSSVGEFVTTVDREGKHVVKISVLNDPKGIAAPIKKSEYVSDNSDDDNLTAHNPSNNYETSSYDSELTTVEISDLNTDGSGYATENEGRNSVYPPSDSLRPHSEDYDTSLTSSVDFQTEGHGEGISHVNSSNASTGQNPKNYFITSVDFTADPADEQTLGSTAATDKNKQGSANPEGKTRHLGRRKRPSSTTEGPQVQSEVVTTTVRSFRRPTGALYNPNRVRLRSTTSTTTTTTTETPVSSTGSEQERRKPGARLVRRRKYGPSANRTADSDATASELKSSDASNNAPTDKDGSGGRVRKFSFPRRRTTTTAPPVTTRPVAVTTLPTTDAPEETQSDIELMESKEHKFTEAEAEADLTTTKLPDLANSAVVAIHNLATVPPTTQPTPEVVKSTRTSLTTTTSSTPATARLFPRRGSAVFASGEPPPSPSPSPRSLPGSVSLKPRPFSKTTAAPVFETDTRARTPKPRPPPVIDYEYYDDEDGILDVAPVSGKVKIHSDGYIECLDRGNFPHPFSCKKFISCAKMENGELLGWEYTCPRQLSFDPIGGICNWSSGLGCKE